MKYQLRVSENGILRSLEDQFTNKSNFLSEAIQNSRRAGATNVHITWKPTDGVLTICDNGTGIASFDDLLNIGESNWDNIDIIERENPFGIGFASCITATDSVEIRSRNEFISFVSSELLNQQPVTSNPIHYPCGTELKLWVRKSYLSDDFKSEVTRIVKGFPIPVYFDGEELPRGHAIDQNDDFFETSLGMISLPSLAKNDFSNYDSVPALYIQGLKINGVHHIISNCGILHLDPSLFRPRVPDREVLKDSAEQTARIMDVIHSLYKDRLLMLKKLCAPEFFVATYWETCIKLGFDDLLDDLPLTNGMLEIFCEPARAVEGSCNADFLGDIDKLGTVISCSDYTYWDDDEQTVLQSVYALECELPRPVHGLPASHRLSKSAIDLNDENIDFQYTLNGISKEGSFKRQGEWFSVVTCESYSVEVVVIGNAKDKVLGESIVAKLAPIEVSDQSFFDHSTKTLIVPAGDSSPATSLVQVCSYEDQFGCYQESIHDSDYSDLHTLCDELRTDSPEQYLNILLNRLSPNHSLLPDNMSFVVKYDNEKMRLLAEVA